jgi:uncharacterized membrane protein
VERFKRNPVGWGIALGAAIFVVSLFLIWVEVTNRSGDSERFRAISSFTGQSLLFAAILAALAGLGVVVTGSRGWRAVLGIIALLLGLLLAAAGAWAVFDPTGFTKQVADANAYLAMTSPTQAESASEALSRAFASGVLEASVRIGAIVGLVGGALTALGALLSFGRQAYRMS